MGGFVRTPEEVEKIRNRMAENRFFSGRRLAIQYLTEESIVKHVLPPGLEPTDRPLAEVEIVEVDESNCVGSFAGGGLYIEARHGDTVGFYCLSMPMNTNPAIVWGRSLFGEPKKRATASLQRTDNSLSGQVSRYDEPIVELEATMETKHEVDPSPRSVFHYKYLPDVTGQGFQFDPTLVTITFETDLHRFETGTGTLSLATTDHDPLGRIEPVEVLGASYSEADMVSSQQNVTTVDPEKFTPYAYGCGKVDDWLQLDNRSGEPSSGSVNSEQ